MGLNEPPKTATRATLFAHLTVALDDVLGGRQLLDADGASCVHARRRDAHLGAHPELTAIDEARGGIDHHGGGVNLAREAPRVGERARHNRLGQARAVAPDVDRKSTRLNSSHITISYAVFCLKKKKKTRHT